MSNVGVCPQESREQALESQLVAARWSSLLGALEEAEQIIQDSLAQIDDPAHIGCTSSAGPSLSPRVGRSLAPPTCGLTSPLCSVSLSADYLASRCQASLDCMERLRVAREGYCADDTSELIH